MELMRWVFFLVTFSMMFHSSDVHATRRHRERQQRRHDDVARATVAAVATVVGEGNSSSESSLSLASISSNTSPAAPVLPAMRILQGVNPAFANRIDRLRNGRKFSTAHTVQFEMSPDLQLEYLCSSESEASALQSQLANNTSFFPEQFKTLGTNVSLEMYLRTSAGCLLSAMTWKGIAFELDARITRSTSAYVLRARLGDGHLSRPAFVGSAVSHEELQNRKSMKVAILQELENFAANPENLSPGPYELNGDFMSLGKKAITQEFTGLVHKVGGSNPSFINAQAWVSRISLVYGMALDYASVQEPPPEAIAVLKENLLAMSLFEQPAPLVVHAGPTTFFLYRLVCAAPESEKPVTHSFFETGLLQNDELALFMYLPQGGIARPLSLGKAYPDSRVSLRLLYEKMAKWHEEEVDGFRVVKTLAWMDPPKSDFDVFRRAGFGLDGSEFYMALENGLQLDFVSHLDLYDKKRPFGDVRSLLDWPFMSGNNGGEIRRVVVDNFEATIHAPRRIPGAADFSITFADRRKSWLKNLTVPATQEQVMPFIHDAIRRQRLIFGSTEDLNKEAQRLLLQIQKLHISALDSGLEVRVLQLEALMDKFKRLTGRWSITPSWYSWHGTLWAQLIALRGDYLALCHEISGNACEDFSRLAEDEILFSMIDSPGYFLNQAFISRLGFELNRPEMAEFYERFPKDDNKRAGDIKIWFLPPVITSSVRGNIEVGVHAFDVLMHFQAGDETFLNIKFTVQYPSKEESVSLVRDFEIWKTPFLRKYDEVMEDELGRALRLHKSGLSCQRAAGGT